MTERLAEAEAHERNFLVRVSHELRTPLTAIRGHVAALREGLADDPSAREASLEVIRAETDRLVRLVGDLVDLSRLEAHSFTLDEHEVELERLVEQGYNSFAEEARRREIRYELSLGAEPGAEHRRRPRPPDRLQPAFERVLLDARRRLRSRSRSRRTTGSSRSRSPTPGPGSLPTTATASSGRSSRENGERHRASASRSRAGARAGARRRPPAGLGGRARLAVRAAPAGALGPAYCAWRPSIR